MEYFILEYRRKTLASTMGVISEGHETSGGGGHGGGGGGKSSPSSAASTAKDASAGTFPLY